MSTLQTCELFLTWFLEVPSVYVPIMCGSCHIQNVLIGVEYPNCRRTLDVCLLFDIWMGPIQSKLFYIFVTYRLASLYVTSLVFDKFAPAE